MTAAEYLYLRRVLILIGAFIFLLPVPGIMVRFAPHLNSGSGYYLFWGAPVCAVGRLRMAAAKPIRAAPSKMRSMPIAKPMK